MKTEPQRQKCQRARNTNATQSGTAGNEPGGRGWVRALLCLLDSRGSDDDVPYVGVKRDTFDPDRPRLIIESEYRKKHCRDEFSRRYKAAEGRGVGGNLQLAP